MELSIAANTQLALVLGHDLQLVVDRAGHKFVIRAMTGNHDVLQTIAESSEPPSDGVLAAARAAAIMLYPDRIDPPAVPAERPIHPHPYERGYECKECGQSHWDEETYDHNYQRGWGCKHCPFDARHHIHDKSARTGLTGAAV